MTILAATAWPSNGHLIADVFELYRYLIGDDPLVLDPTYGKGNWWTVHKPARLIGHSRETTPSWDFRRMPLGYENAYDVVAYDPPYVCAGGRKTTTIPGMHQAYGMDDAPTTPATLQLLINDGLRECWRVTKPGGLILVKCQDYISSGKLWPGTHYTLSFALGAFDLTLLDRFEHISGKRPQPTMTKAKPAKGDKPATPAKPRRVMHARRNLSTLFVFRKSK